MKKLLAMLFTLSLVLTMVGCAGTTGSTAAPSGETSGAQTEEPEQSGSETEPAGETEFSWEGSGTVTVYSGNASDISEDYFEAFTELTGVTVEPVYGGGGELLNRVAAESENPLADVLIGATSDVLESFTEYFEPYQLQSVEPDMLGQASLDKAYWPEDAGGNIMIFLVNTNLLAEEDIPTSWADLTDEKYFGQIAMGDPTASTSAYIHVCIMEQLYGWDFVEDFYRNLDGKIIGSSSTIPKATADGEFSIALTIENYGADYVAVAPHMKVIYPEDGTMRTAGGSVIIKNSKNPENAKLFVEFMYSKQIAEIVASYNRRPSRTDVSLPDGLGQFKDITFMDYDYDRAGDMEGNVEKWNEIVINN